MGSSLLPLWRRPYARPRAKFLNSSFIVAEQPDVDVSKSFFGNVFGLLKQTFQEWLEDKAPQLGAALAYYTVFSLAPLILVLLAVVGIIFQE